MKTTLHIRWDGQAPGLTEHRLSLATWLEPMGLLLRSVRRTASRLLNDALDDSEQGLHGGRYAKAAERIDLEIAAIRDGCVNVEFVVIGGEPDDQLSLFPHLPADLPARALAKVLEDIELESAGQMRNASVRAYLKKLPDGVSTHSYKLTQDGKSVRTALVEGAATLPELPPEPSSLQRIHGRIVGVGFEPLSVLLKSEAGKLSCTATAEQVNTAITMRARDVVAMCVVSDKKSRLIWLHPANELPAVPDEDARTRRFLSDWSKTLELLSR